MRELSLCYKPSSRILVRTCTFLILPAGCTSATGFCLSFSQAIAWVRLSRKATPQAAQPCLKFLWVPACTQLSLNTVGCISSESDHLIMCFKHMFHTLSARGSWELPCAQLVLLLHLFMRFDHPCHCGSMSWPVSVQQNSLLGLDLDGLILAETPAMWLNLH